MKYSWLQITNGGIFSNFYIFLSCLSPFLWSYLKSWKYEQAGKCVQRKICICKKLKSVHVLGAETTFVKDIIFLTTSSVYILVSGRIHFSSLAKQGLYWFAWFRLQRFLEGNKKTWSAYIIYYSRHNNWKNRFLFTLLYFPKRVRGKKFRLGIKRNLEKD